MSGELPTQHVIPPTTESSTQGAHEGSSQLQPQPSTNHAPATEVGSQGNMQVDTPAPLAASPISSPTTLIQKNTPHAKSPEDINSHSETTGNNNNTILHQLPPSTPPRESNSLNDSAATPDVPPSPPTPKSPSSPDGQSSTITVIKEPLQPEVELPEQQFQDRSPIQSPIEYTQDKTTLKNLNLKRQLPDSIPTELDSKKIKRNELLMNDVNEKHARRILSKLLKDPWAPPFETPVDPDLLGLPDYFDVIKRPMDLGTVSNNLNDKKYTTVSAFGDDVRLVFNNAMTYNAVRSDIHKAARNFLTEFEDLMRNTPWAQAYDTKIPEVTTPIIAISKGSLLGKPTPVIRTEVTHIEEPRSLAVAVIGSPPSPPLPSSSASSLSSSSKSDRRNGSHPRTGGKHGGYNCLVYYQNETIPYDFEWQQIHSREDFEQKLRSALGIPSMAELEIGIKRSKPNFGREVFVQLSPRWEEFPRVSCILVKHKKL